MGDDGGEDCELTVLKTDCSLLFFLLTLTAYSIASIPPPYNDAWRAHPLHDTLFTTDLT